MEKILKQLLEGQKQLLERVTNIESNMATKADLVRIENELGRKIGGLYDAREVQKDVNERILASLERIEAKTENHDIKIAVLDRRKRVIAK